MAECKTNTNYETISKFKKVLINEGYSVHSVNNMTHRLKKFCDFIGEKKIEKCDSSDFIKFIESRNTHNTKCSIITTVKIYFKLILNQKFNYSIAERYKRLKTTTLFTPEEFYENSKKISNIKHRCLITVAYVLALKLNEVSKIKIEDIDFVNNKIAVYSNYNGVRVLPISDNVMYMIGKYIEIERPVEYLFLTSEKGFYCHQQINIILKETMGEKVTLKTLKEQRLLHMAMKGIDLNYLHYFSGHSNMNTTRYYKQDVKTINENIRVDF